MGITTELIFRNVPDYHPSKSQINKDIHLSFRNWAHVIGGQTGERDLDIRLDVFLVWWREVDRGMFPLNLGEIQRIWYCPSGAVYGSHPTLLLTFYVYGVDYEDVTEKSTENHSINKASMAKVGEDSWE